MRLYSITGKLIYKDVSSYKMDWDSKSRSKIQFAVKKFLKPLWKTTICFEEFPVYGSLMKVDFLNATLKIAIEVDGEQHDQFNPHFHNKSRLNYLSSIKRDMKKEEWLQKNEYRLARIIEPEIKLLSPEFFYKKFGFKIV